MVAFGYLLSKHLLGLFLKSRSTGNSASLVDGMRYVGYTIIGSFLGLMLALSLVSIFTIPSTLIRTLIVYGSFFFGAGIGAFIAYLFPGSLHN